MFLHKIAYSSGALHAFLECCTVTKDILVTETYERERTVVSVHFWTAG